MDRIDNANGAEQHESGHRLIAALIFIGATLLAAWIVYRRAESGTRK